MASLLPYLKRLEIVEVEESDTPTTVNSYLPIKEVVEAVDQEGNPWEPVPGPDPWDALVVSEKALLHESNIYEIGETVYATTATYIGGDVGQTTYRWRWQWRQASDGTWANAPWTAYDNTLKQVSYTIPNGGEIRFQCQARDESQDPVEQINSFSVVKKIPFAALVASDPTITGLPYVGETITCSEPVVTGGLAPYTFTYTWKAAQAFGTDSTIVIPPNVAGRSGFCEVTVIDAVDNSITVTSNTIGPIEFYTIGTVTATIDGAPYDIAVGAPVTVMSGDSVVLATSISGDASPSYTWTVKSGSASFTGTGSTVTALINTVPPGQVQIQCDIVDTNASDNPFSFRYGFLIGE